MKLDWTKQSESPKWNASIYLNRYVRFYFEISSAPFQTGGGWYGRVMWTQSERDIRTFRKPTIEEAKQSCEQFIEDFIKQITLGGLKLLVSGNKE